MNAFVGAGLARAQADLRKEGREERKLGFEARRTAVQEAGVGFEERRVGVSERTEERAGRTEARVTAQTVRDKNNTAYSELTKSIALMKSLPSDPDTSRVLPVLIARRDSLGKTLKISKEQSQVDVLQAERDLTETFTLGAGQQRLSQTPGQEPQVIAQGAAQAGAAPKFQAWLLPNGKSIQLPAGAPAPASATAFTLQAGQAIDAEGNVVNAGPEQPPGSPGAVIAPLIQQVSEQGIESLTPNQLDALQLAASADPLIQIALENAQTLGGFLTGDDLDPDEKAAVEAARSQNMTEEQFREFAKTTNKSPESLEKIAKALGFTLDGE